MFRARDFEEHTVEIAGQLHDLGVFKRFLDVLYTSPDGEMCKRDFTAAEIVEKHLCSETKHYAFLKTFTEKSDEILTRTLELVRGIINGLERRCVYSNFEEFKSQFRTSHCVFCSLKLAKFNNVLSKCREFESILIDNCPFNSIKQEQQGYILSQIFYIKVQQVSDDELNIIEEVYKPEVTPSQLDRVHETKFTTFQALGVSKNLEKINKDCSLEVPKTRKDIRRSPIAWLLSGNKDDRFLEKIVESFVFKFWTSDSISLENMDYVLTFITAALEYFPKIDYNESRTPTLKQFSKMIDMFSISKLVKEFDYGLLQGHISLIKKKFDMMLGFDVDTSLKDSIVRIQVIQAYVMFQNLASVTVTARSFSVFFDPALFLPEKKVLVADDISVGSILLWKQKLQKYSTVDEIKYKYEDNCAICMENFNKGQEVAILSGCDHVFCFSCIEAWFGVSSSANETSCPVCKTVANDFMRGSNFQRMKENFFELPSRKKRKLF